MFNQITDSYRKIFHKLRGLGKINDSNISDAARDIRIAMLDADVNFQVVKTFVNRVKEKAIGLKLSKSIKPGEYFIKIIHQEIITLLGEGKKELDLKKSPSIILLAGLQGSGKTTTAGKLAKFLGGEKSVLLVGADNYRPAAIEQLIKIGKQIEIDVYYDRNLSPKSVIKNAVNFSITNKIDIVIIDTAGRTQIEQPMMDEIKDISKSIDISELLFIVDGMSGQDAINSAKIFNDKLALTGVILTKMDGDSRGGVALSIKETIGKPIKFLGISEKLDGLEVFDSEKLANRLLGFGDILSLVGKAQDIIKEEDSLVFQKKLINNKFDLNDFKTNIKQLKNSGIFKEIFRFLPGFSRKNIKINDSEIALTESIIDSMTPYERSNPHLIDGSRRLRIAKGSGRSVQEINFLIKNFMNMKKMIKKFSSNKKNILPIFGMTKNFN
ncbi:MAG: signal recognition particle protein [Candidatus Marinimicrobia bacterium]|nr:signal recognition particle protein [Candidatus Neomarinimicrobiota bacterium]